MESQVRTTNDTIIEKLKALCNSCIDDAREQGYEGIGDAYTYTAADMEYITDHIIAEHDRKPTAKEWEAAGLSYVGSAHCADA